MHLNCVVLAAGLGTRMKSAIPKVLHTVCGIPMLKAVIAVVKRLNPERILVVVGKQGELIKNTIGSHEVSYILQGEPRGTGHASAAQDLLSGILRVSSWCLTETPLF